MKKCTNCGLMTPNLFCFKLGKNIFCDSCYKNKTMEDLDIIPWNGRKFLSIPMY